MQRLTYTTQSVERRELLLLVGDLAELDDGLRLNDGLQLAAELRGGLALLLGGLALAQLAVGVDGEQDQLAAVLLQSLHVLLARLDRLVVATTVDRDADGARKGWGQTSSLDANKDSLG